MRVVTLCRPVISAGFGFDSCWLDRLSCLCLRIAQASASSTILSTCLRLCMRPCRRMAATMWAIAGLMAVAPVISNSSATCLVSASLL
eukprot:scaffold208398_cov25-Prasinocladus_malaysianus.AAC.1